MKTLADSIIGFKDNYKGSVVYNAPLAKLTTMKVGGAAKVLFTPASTKSLTFLIKTLVAKGEKFFILGGGSNIIVSDLGLPYSVICTSKIVTITPNYSTEEKDCVELTCGAGVTIASITKYCVNNFLTGFEEFSGLPGTLGGAVYMNARCFSREISQVLSAVSYQDIEEDCKVLSYKYDSKDWQYKTSPFNTSKMGEKVIISATLKLTKLEEKAESQDKIIEKNKEFIKMRAEKGHYAYPSAGSVFLNNHEYGKPSGKIIEECGLKGVSIGGAKVSPLHANFIVNTGMATSNDIKNLVKLVQEEVKTKTGLLLTPEIIFVGE